MFKHKLAYERCDIHCAMEGSKQALVRMPDKNSFSTFGISVSIVVSSSDFDSKFLLFLVTFISHFFRSTEFFFL